MRGAVDKITTQGVVGWFYGGTAAVRPTMQALLQQNVIGTAAADLYRPDLEQVGFGDGRCGFEIQFHTPVEPAYIPFVKVRPNGIDLDIPVTSNQSFIDLASAITSDYPSAGRNRSILGGLWTDRTDAAQVLAGRIATGGCPAELQAGLQGLIVNGHVGLTGALAPVGVSERDLKAITDVVSAPRQEDSAAASKATLSTIMALFFREAAVKLLRQVFDDHPVVYRLDLLRGEQGFLQACSVEQLPSPAECVLVYVGPPEISARLDVVRNSHELGEIGPNGKSRWTRAGGGSAVELARSLGLSVESFEFDATDMLVVGPGAIHRVCASEAQPVVRALCAPRRVTPQKFLSGDGSWLEAWHVSGAGIRV